MKRSVAIRLSLCIVGILLAALPLAAQSAQKNIRAVMDMQNARNVEGLVPYLSNKDATLRAAAAEAFGSVQDKGSLPVLTPLLYDSDPAVRAAAAYAIGQTGAVSSGADLIAALAQEKNPLAIRALYEALGKCADAYALAHIAYYGRLETSSEAIEGVSLGLFRALVWKNLSSPAGTDLAFYLLTKEDNTGARLYAANYLARIKKIDLNPQLSTLKALVSQEPDPTITLALVRAFGKCSGHEALDFLIGLLSDERDYRIAVAAITALADYPWADTKDSILEAAASEQPNIASNAADIAARLAQPEDAGALIDASYNSSTWYAYVSLLGKAYLLAQSAGDMDTATACLTGLQDLYDNEDDLYIRAQTLYYIGSDPLNASFVADEALANMGNIIGTQGFTALSEQAGAIKNDAALKDLYVEVLREAVESHDGGTIATIAAVLRDPDLGFKEAYTDTSFLTDAFAALELPRDIEAYVELAQTLEYFTGSHYIVPVAMPEPIYWDLLDVYGSAPRALIVTSKGEITLDLFPEKSPASVANFIALSIDNYFNGKTLHRVVPNFVVQGGCDRGDGYGAPDYVIASELGSYYYGEGSIGMASAGKDTEGEQWFITHNPTPHLDGRYSIFGKVSAGMDVVAAIEVGDLIESITITPGN